MFSGLVALFGTSGFGAILGALGGLVNRWMDFKTKTLEIELKKMDHAHDEKMREIDLQAMQMEVDGKIQVATIEGEAKVEAAGYAALSASYDHDSKLKGTPFTDFCRAIIRPLITVIFVGIICYVNYRVWSIMDSQKLELTAAQLFEIIRWTLFEASVVIGWWFAARPTGSAGLRLSTK